MTARPALRLRSGRASSAASAEPKRLSNCRNVTGPIVSVRASRSHAIFWADVNVVVTRPIASSRLLAAADCGLRALEQATDIFAMLEEEQQRQPGHDHGQPLAG